MLFLAWVPCFWTYMTLCVSWFGMANLLRGINFNENIFQLFLITLILFISQLKASCTLYPEITTHFLLGFDFGQPPFLSFPSVIHFTDFFRSKFLAAINDFSFDNNVWRLAFHCSASGRKNTGEQYISHIRKPKPFYPRIKISLGFFWISYTTVSIFSSKPFWFWASFHDRELTVANGLPLQQRPSTTASCTVAFSLYLLPPHHWYHHLAFYVQTFYISFMMVSSFK